MTDLHVGLISGTSMDGIDAVVVDLAPARPELLASNTFEFPADIHSALDTLRADPDQFPLRTLGWLDARLGQALGRAAKEIVANAGLHSDQISAIGSHGQTVLHRIDSDPSHTLQIGDPSRIAEITGITTVADFRRADVAAGGQGAPLAPLIHAAMLGQDEERRAVINLGGIANITLLKDHAIQAGFDSGPANCFLDLWYRRHHPDRFDHQGQWASEGKIDAAWLHQLLDDPYFGKPPPKSTGIEYFSARWLEQRLPKWSNDRPQDIQATLAEFSARTLAGPLSDISLDRVLICGGGVHNHDLVQRISSHLNSSNPNGLPIEATDSHGLPADHVESVLFAWLAAQRLAGVRLATNPVTGAVKSVCLGSIYSA